MNKKSRRSTNRVLERTVARQRRAHYDLRLYVSGMTPRSSLAIENVNAVCEEYLPGRYQLQVVDIYQNPTQMLEDQVVAATMLVKRLPLPTKLLVGDMSDRARVLSGLKLRAK